MREHLREDTHRPVEPDLELLGGNQAETRKVGGTSGLETPGPKDGGEEAGVRPALAEKALKRPSHVPGREPTAVMETDAGPEAEAPGLMGSVMSEGFQKTRFGARPFGHDQERFIEAWEDLAADP
jgi:hypothetical protein